MKISQRIAVGFFIICLFVVISGLVGFLYTNAINNRLNDVAEVTSPAMEMMNDMITSLLKNNNAMRIFASESKPSRLDELRNRFDKLNTDFNAAELNIRKLVEDEKVLANIETATKRHREFNNKAIDMMNARIEELNARTAEEKSNFGQRKKDLLVELEALTEEAVAILDEVTETVESSNIQAGRESFRAVKNMRVILTLTTVVSMLSAIIIGFFLSKSIARPMNQLAEAAAHVSSGNFNVEVKSGAHIEEMGRLCDTFNQMTKSLKSMVEESPRMKKFLKLKPQLRERRFELEPRNSYLLKEANARRSYELFLEKVGEGFNGLCITRNNPAEIREKYELATASLLWLSDIKDSMVATAPDIAAVQKKVVEFVQKSMRSIILIDRIDYLLTKHGFDEVIRFLVRLNDRIAVTNALLLVSIDPSTLNQRELSLLEKELKEVPISVTAAVPEELLRIVSFIVNQKKMGRTATYKDVGKHFNITAPTTQKKLKELEEKGLIRVVKQGRNKLLEVTPEGFAVAPSQ